MNIERMRKQYRNGEISRLPGWFIKNMDKEMLEMEMQDAKESEFMENIKIKEEGSYLAKGKWGIDDFEEWESGAKC